MSAYSTLATPSATRAVLEAHGLSTKKSLGQHFLANDAIVGKILDLADVQPGDAVLEVGPGIGTLTVALLAAGAQVVAVERDPALPAVLEETCAEWADRFTLLQMDALDVRLEHLPGSENGAPFAPTKFVANLPYAVAATLVLDYFERFGSLDSATVMVQAEVADRMQANPGTKDYGAYTVKLGLHAQPVGRFKVGPGNFFPPPRVDSAVIRLNRSADDRLSPEECRAAATMADAAFASRRKTLANSCKTYFAGQPEVAAALPAIFEVSSIDPAVRGETLSQEDFVKLGKALIHFAEKQYCIT